MNSLSSMFDSTAFSGAQVLPIGGSIDRLTVHGPHGDWWKIVKPKLDELVRLPKGWDGYAGEPTSFSNAYFAARVLEEGLRRAQPAHA